MSRAARPEGPAADGARLEPDGCAELDSWLDDTEFSSSTEKLERLLGDQDLLLNLQLNQYSEKSWAPVAEELARYGLAVIGSWLRRRTIFVKVKKRTTYGLPTPPETWLDDAHVVRHLTDETVVLALNYFKDKVLKENKWDVLKGASIKTFFIGQCLFQFANVYSAWFREEQERRDSEYFADDDELGYLRGSVRGTEDSVLARSDLDEALRKISSESARAAFILKAQGYRYQEIASKLGLANSKAVENLLVYQRRLIRGAS